MICVQFYTGLNGPHATTKEGCFHGGGFGDGSQLFRIDFHLGSTNDRVFRTSHTHALHKGLCSQFLESLVVVSWCVVFYFTILAVSIAKLMSSLARRENLAIAYRRQGP